MSLTTSSVKKKSSISEHPIFHLSLLFAFLKKCQMDVLEPEILCLSTMHTKASQASPTTCLSIASPTSSSLDMPVLRGKYMTTFWA